MNSATHGSGGIFNQAGLGKIEKSFLAQQFSFSLRKLRPKNPLVAARRAALLA